MKAFVSVIVALLALAVGVLHLLLDFVLFQGRFVSNPPPPGAVRPGAPPGGPPSPLPVPFIGHSLPTLFLANFVASIVLVALFLLALRLAYGYRFAAGVLLIAFAVATLVGWNNLHRPNPRGLGYAAVGLEAALVVFVLIHMAVSARKPAPARAAISHRSS